MIHAPTRVLGPRRMRATVQSSLVEALISSSCNWALSCLSGLAGRPKQETLQYMDGQVFVIALSFTMAHTSRTWFSAAPLWCFQAYDRKTQPILKLHELEWFGNHGSPMSYHGKKATRMQRIPGRGGLDCKRARRIIIGGVVEGDVWPMWTSINDPQKVNRI